MNRFLGAAAIVLLAACGGGGGGGGDNGNGNNGDGGSNTLTITPDSAAILAGATQSFSANTPVTWRVQEQDAGGNVTTAGLYTAPSAAGVYHLVATSAADPSKSATVLVAVTRPGGIVTDVVPAARRTPFAPGIPGGIPSRTTVCQTVNASAYRNGADDASDDIQTAIKDCPENSVIRLSKGVFRINASLVLNRGVVLRGAGPDATGVNGTRLNNYSGAAAIYFSDWAQYDSGAVDVSENVAKGATEIPVASITGFAKGDIVQIDQLDDVSYVYDGNCQWWKRPDYGPATSGHRSQGQTLEVTGVDAAHSRLQVSPELHLGYKASLAPQVFKPSNGTTKYAGLEELYVTGGANDQIHMMNCAYCWVKHIESDGTVSSNAADDGTLGKGRGMAGAHMLVDSSFRVVVRDSYFHHATHVAQGGGAYGISLSSHTSDSLVENNIVYYLNKPLTLRASGGGNVIAYNYIDDAWTSVDDRLQETTIDLGHTSFPYMELVEGNWAAQIATESVWGNSGWMTIFRNYASGKQKRTDAKETYQIAAIAFEAKSIYMNVVGNVLGSTGNAGQTARPFVYEVTTSPPGSDQPAVFRLGHGVGAGDGWDFIDRYEDPKSPDSTASMLLRHGNYDYVTNSVGWDAATVDHNLPPSLYLTAKPAFFGTLAWPWVDPVGARQIRLLPAKERFDAGTPNRL